MLLRKTRAWWIETLEAGDVPCGPINDLSEVFDDPQVLARQMRLDMPHPTAGHISVPASALKLGLTPVEYRSPPPLLGEHTHDVLRELAGVTDNALRDLQDRNII
jgi:formyl-CoA transferase